MKCICDWSNTSESKIDIHCEVHGSLTRVYFPHLHPGMKIVVEDCDYIVTDKIKQDWTAWENYEFDIRTLFDPLTGKTKEINGLSPPDIWVRR